MSQVTGSWLRIYFTLLPRNSVCGGTRKQTNSPYSMSQDVKMEAVYTNRYTGTNWLCYMGFHA
jgi:hypothetical protein